MSTSFRLLDLPQEIQDRIYDLYFEENQVSIAAGYQVTSNSCMCDTPETNSATGYPSLSIERASKKTYADSRAARDRKGMQKLTVTFDRYTAQFLDTTLKDTAYQ